MELSGERGKAFVAVRKLLERGVVTGGDGEELSCGLRKLFDLQAIALAQDFSLAGWHIGIDIPDAWAGLHQRYVHQDPSVRKLGAAPIGETFLIDRDCSATEKDVDLYWHLRDQGMFDGLIARVHNPFVDDLAIVMYRANGAPPFNENDEEVFRALYPHLASGLAARRALAALSEPASEGMRAMLRRVDGHAFLSFPSGVIAWSQPARELWQHVLDIDGEAGWRRAERMLQASARQFHAAWQWGGRSQSLFPGLRIEWASVPPRRGEQRRLLALMTREPAASESPSPLESLLTPRQRVVARAATAGKTASEIAGDLDISTETVRWTMREVYRRLGVHRRAELVAALARRG